MRDCAADRREAFLKRCKRWGFPMCILESRDWRLWESYAEAGMTLRLAMRGCRYSLNLGVFSYSLLRTIERLEGSIDYMGFIDRAIKAQVAGNSSTKSHDAGMATCYPALHEYLTEPIQNSRKEWRTSTMTVFCQDGKWGCCVNIRARDLTVTRMGDSFDECLAAVDKELQSEAPGFRLNKSK